MRLAKPCKRGIKFPFWGRLRGCTLPRYILAEAAPGKASVVQPPDEEFFEWAYKQIFRPAIFFFFLSEELGPLLKEQV